MIPENATLVWQGMWRWREQQDATWYEPIGMSDTIGGIVVYSQRGTTLLRIAGLTEYGKRMVMNNEELIYNIIRARYSACLNNP